MGRQKILRPKQVIRRGKSNVPYTREACPEIFPGQDDPSGLGLLPKAQPKVETPGEQPPDVCIAEIDALDKITKALGGIVDREGAIRRRPPEG